MSQAVEAVPNFSKTSRNRKMSVKDKFDNSGNYEDNVDDMKDSMFVYNKLQIGSEDDPTAVVIDGQSTFNCTKLISQTWENGKRYSLDFKAVDRLIYVNLPNCRSKVYIVCETIKQLNEDNSRTEGHSTVRTLIDFLSYNRYTVISRKVHIDNDTQKSFDTSMDVEITSALFKAAEYAKHIVFFGSSKKFVEPLKYLHSKGITITVVSSINTASPNFMADELRKIDNFIDLADEKLVNIINNRKKSVHNMVKPAQDLAAE